MVDCESMTVDRRIGMFASLATVFVWPAAR
jgi:hypothetical protein